MNSANDQPARRRPATPSTRTHPGPAEPARCTSTTASASSPSGGQPEGEEEAPDRAAARRPARRGVPGPRRRRAAARRQQRDAPGGDAGEERVGAGGDPQRGRREDGERRDDAGGGLVGHGADGDQHGRHGERAAGDAQRRRPARAAEAEPVEEHEGQQRARRVPGDVGRPTDRPSPPAPTRRRSTGRCPIPRPGRRRRGTRAAGHRCGERPQPPDRASATAQPAAPAALPASSDRQRTRAGERRPPQHTGDRPARRAAAPGGQHDVEGPPRDVPAAQVQVAAVPGDRPARPARRRARRRDRERRPARGDAARAGAVGAGSDVGGAAVTSRRVGGGTGGAAHEPDRRPAPNTRSMDDSDATPRRSTSSCPASTRRPSLPWVLSRLPAGYRAIVADNGSTDGSAAIAAEHGATVVHVPAARLRRRRARRPGGRRRPTSSASATPTARWTPPSCRGSPTRCCAGDGRPRARPAPPLPRRLAGARPGRQLALARHAARGAPGLAARPRADAGRPPRGAARPRPHRPPVRLPAGDGDRARPTPAGGSARSTSTTRLRTEGTKSKVTGTVLGTVRTIRDMRGVLAR